MFESLRPASSDLNEGGLIHVPDLAQTALDGLPDVLQIVRQTQRIGGAHR